MLEFMLAGIPLLLLLMTIIQLSLLWIDKGAVDTAAHFAARKLARTARVDFPNARQEAFLEACRTCMDRPTGSMSSVAITTLDITRDCERKVEHAASGDALCVRLTHGVELVVPWVDWILYLLSPGPKTQLGNRYYLMLQSTRWVTVE
jgi:Flp pilus assembly protein TadG